MNRRELLRAAGALSLVSAFPLGWTAAQTGQKKRVLMFTRSQTFEHSCIKRPKPDQLSHAERIATDLGKDLGFEVTCTKDGRTFLPEELAKYDAFFFYTTGDLTKEGGDKNPPMPVEGKAALLKAVESGKGFIGSHCASDTFHSAGPGNKNQEKDRIDPYIAMLGGEFIVHGDQFKARMVVTSDTFPATKGVKDFMLMEEWYALKNFAPDLHVVLCQDSTEAEAEWRKSGDPKVLQRNRAHIRPLHPATWARRHGQGRVFYTSMGHREDVWTNPTFQKVLLGGLAWALGNVEADVSPNMAKVAPKAMDLPG